MKLAKIFAISFLAMLLFGLFGQAEAVSEETTGLQLANTNRNQGSYAKVGDFYIFSTDLKLLFYLSDGSLAKTWNIPATETTKVVTSIMAINDTHLLVANAWSNGVEKIDVYNLNVNTLAYTLIVNDLQVAALASFHDVVIVKTSNDNYYVICSVANSVFLSCTTRVLRVLPTYASIGLTTSMDFVMVLDSSLWMLSGTSPTDTAYIITRSTKDASTRYRIFKVVLTTATFTLVGTSGLDDDYGRNIFMIGSAYTTVGSNSYYDVLVAYPHNSVAENIYVGLIRFNDTYIATDTRISGSYSSSVSYLRVFSAGYSGIRDPFDLVEGSYRPVFVVDDYAFNQQSFTLADLDTEAPTLTWDYSPVTYQGKSHYYVTSNDVGGFQPPEWNVGIMIDYQNGKAVADTFSASEAEWTYSYTFSPSVTEISGIIQINASQNYIYTGTLLASGLANANGYYKRYISYNGVNYTLQATGTLLNGQIRFSFSDMNPEIWWRLEITAQNYGDAVYTKYHHLLSSTYVPPGGGGGLTVPDTTGALNYGMGLAITFLIPLLLVAAPAMILGAAVGMPGIFIGLLLGLGVGGISGIVPLWMVIFIVFAMFLVLYLGGGGAAVGKVVGKIRGGDKEEEEEEED